MKLGIMQPYFFPYIGYFSLINYVDKFVLFDTPQYINHGWINRNRIIKQGGGSTYIMVPLKKSCRETPINEMYIDNSKSWKDKILGQLTIYKRKAPYCSSMVGFVQQILEGDYNKISDLDEKVLYQFVSI